MGAKIMSFEKEISTMVTDILRAPIEKLDLEIYTRYHELQSYLEETGRSLEEVISQGIYEGLMEMDNSPMGQLMAGAIYGVTLAGSMITEKSYEQARDVIAQNIPDGFFPSYEQGEVVKEVPRPMPEFMQGATSSSDRSHYVSPDTGAGLER
ncbi:hypothetical protein [Sessilibacter corallicola]